MTQHGMPLSTPLTQQRPILTFTLLLATLTALYLLVFWPTLQGMELIWRHSETYMHGYLIAPISLWLLYRQRQQLSRLQPEPTVLPAILALPLLLIWLLAYSININFVSQFAAVFYLQLLIWSLLGHRFMRYCWFPIGFLIFLVPFGEAANPILQQITADLVVAMLQLINMPVYRDGLYLHTASAVFEVAVACSGLNFLLSSLVLSCLFAYLHYQRLYKAALFIALVLLLSILANGIRAFLLVVIGEKSQMAYGFGADHYYYGWLVFFIVMFCSFWLGAKFSDDNPVPAAEVPAATSRSFKLAAIALVLPLSLAGVLSKTLPAEATPEMAARLFSDVPPPDTRAPWGIQFYDGLSRDHWHNSEGIEFFYATYANRQQQGDLITWHNTLFNLEHWSIRHARREGTLLQSYGVLELVNPQGQVREVQFWYQLGGYQTNSRVAFKLLQLRFLWLQKAERAEIIAVSSIHPDPSIRHTHLEQARSTIKNISVGKH